MVEYEEIIIDWTERKNIEDVEKIESNTLYQIYGNHHIYGKDVLLYIGISKDNIARIKQHVKGVFGYVHNLYISLGTIEKKLNGEKFEIPESILIANHKPAFNKEYIHTIDSNAMEHKIIVINNGHHGVLKSCCTNFWWVDNKKG